MTGVTAAEAVPAMTAGVPKPTASVMTASARRLRILLVISSLTVNQELDVGAVAAQWL